MNKVIPFQPKDSNKQTIQTITGLARCQYCQHEWVAVVPPGTQDLECPECNSMKGLLVHSAIVLDEPMWACHCGCEAFRITPTRLICYNCGETTQRDEA